MSRVGHVTPRTPTPVPPMPDAASRWARGVISHSLGPGPLALELCRPLEPDRSAVPYAYFLSRRDGAERDQRHRLLVFLADQLRVRRVAVVAQRDDAKDDARPLSVTAEAEVVVAEARLFDPPGVGRVVHNHRAR